jgi:hypothetical protein
MNFMPAVKETWVILREFVYTVCVVYVYMSLMLCMLCVCMCCMGVVVYVCMHFTPAGKEKGSFCESLCVLCVLCMCMSFECAVCICVYVYM